MLKTFGKFCIFVLGIGLFVGGIGFALGEPIVNCLKVVAGIVGFGIALFWIVVSGIWILEE